MTRPRDLLTLLDVEAMAEHVRAIPVLASGAARLDAIALDRVWVKPGRHVHTSYRLGLESDAGGTETHAVAALAPSPEAARTMERRALEARGPATWAARQSTVRLEEPPLLVQLFPWDYRLPTLPSALSPGAVGDELGLPGLRAATVAGYWPGMRCQVRYVLEGGGALYGKVFTDTDGLRAVATTLQTIGARADLGFATPRLEACVPSLRLLVTRELPGTSLLASLAEPGVERTLVEVAGALARLHDLRATPTTRRFTSADDVATVRGWVDLVGQLFPELAGPAATALAALERARVDGAGSLPALVHRDFYDKQVLVGAGPPALLDLDTLARGDAEIDLGNFGAHLVLRALQRPSGHWDPDATSEGFLDAYRAVRPRVDVRLVGWYRASALLRLACVYALRPWWRQLAPHLIDSSRRTIDS